MKSLLVVHGSRRLPRAVAPSTITASASSATATAAQGPLRRCLSVVALWPASPSPSPSPSSSSSCASLSRRAAGRVWSASASASAPMWASAWTAPSRRWYASDFGRASDDRNEAGAASSASSSLAADAAAAASSSSSSAEADVDAEAAAAITIGSSSSSPALAAMSSALEALDGAGDDELTLLDDTANASHNKAPKPKMRVRDILATKTGSAFTLPQDTTIGDAISILVENKMSSSLVVNTHGEVVGIFTVRDILRFMHSQGQATRTGKEVALTMPIGSVMTDKEKLVYCSPNDSVKRCREIMFQLKIRNIPVIDKGEALGIITIKDLADSAFSLTDIGGKKAFISNVTGRKGLPQGTKLTKEASGVTGERMQPLEVDLGSYALPHPFKHSNGVACSQRDYGASEYCTDITLCEDAHFAIRVNNPAGSQPYMCVADGVGSWRQYGIDPRQFSYKLVKNSQNVIESDSLQRELIEGSNFGDGGGLELLDPDPIHPLDAMMDAWNLTLGEKITGSSTICIATVEKKLNQLSYSNLGDCGLMVIRHIDSETAGYMRVDSFRERQLPRHLRTNDLRIAYLSQQQLKSFNLPYQLGYSDIPEHKGSFENPNDSDTASIAIYPGDIIVMATDGLFDNLDLNEIVTEVSQWELKHFPPSGGMDINRGRPDGNQVAQALAKQLVLKARELSLDPVRDSPFAVLAKENDIMWGGGMPDDTTVVVARVYSPETFFK